MQFALPTEVEDLGRRFTSAGHPLYVVGGAVRDLVMNRTVTDYDFATSARPEQTTDILEDWADSIFAVGEKFGTIGAIKNGHSLEVTTFRKEGYVDGSRKPIVVFEGVDLMEDLKRRDFTINAMAIEVPKGILIDPFHGYEAILDKLLITPLPPVVTFSEDPLRMLRAARFVSTLRFTVSPGVASEMSHQRHGLSSISRERIQQELDKLLIGGEPSVAIRLLITTGLMDLFLLEVPVLRNLGTAGGRHKDVFAHTLAVVDAVPPIVELRLAALLHDIGKPVTRELHNDGTVTFHQHEVVGAKMARARMRDLRYPDQTIQRVSRMIAMHVRWYERSWTDGAVRRMVREAGEDFNLLLQLIRADNTGTDPRYRTKYRQLQDEFEARVLQLREQEELASMRPALDGNEVMTYLGLPPTPEVGKVMHFLMEIRLDEGEISKEEAYRRIDQFKASR